MLDNKGFDLWADDYDKSVGISDDDNSYPFAGYKEILNKIYNEVLSIEAKNLLDIGFGTSRLYEKGIEIYGKIFQKRWLLLQKRKCPMRLYISRIFQKGWMKSFLQINMMQYLQHIPSSNNTSRI
ncbi:hypothetical protein [uncultured Anaerococcus sp.]|uniref:hypothetical protein n=1 Tax=Anaerococcus sp. AH8042_DFU013_CI05 TaxID=3385202 RepID=UPI0025E32669|nr:hypothetical protein [uncultured Anaerococcus sp.]